ncbi:response regulator transcription factor [Photobacterium sp. CCB-ST2H9]|uniref:response regulator transcription factor n=1 Tax=unclassified Photobacterium TaxID=2628852 RepID=UPI00200531D0|nr:response regulator transcription factor [Photobacterium sp. CCB-ST2H9]UTM59406.1 response regulator transcription factor [Photobacterium sp. CCB-ST2H9]
MAKGRKMQHVRGDDRKYTIMLVEDDQELACLIGDFLETHEFRVLTVGNGVEAVSQILEKHPDLVILDIMLPGMSGMDVCRQVREDYKGMILMQTALDDDIDQVMGLELGADDYVIKQVQPRLLLSRVRALLRRMHRDTGEGRAESLVVGELNIDLHRRTVVFRNQLVDLTTAEFELLYLLAQQSGEVVSREEIMQQIRGYEYDGLDRSIDRRISRLRRSLDDDPANPQLIKTIRGIGYQLCMPVY